MKYISQLKNSPQMRKLISIVFLLLCGQLFAQPQIAQDDFEGNSTINTWFGDDCGMDINTNNPLPNSNNPSAKVLKYTDVGGQYANVRFDAGFNFNLSSSSVFSLKIYVPSTGITGNQPNRISLKLQNGSIGSPWTTQCEIIKSVVLNQWQTITFNFASDPFINLDPSSVNPLYRNDFNRVVLQVNGENNTSRVVAYLDDFLYSGNAPTGYNLIWSDEFDGSGAVNNLKWHHQTQLPNGTSWYNGEVQHYTNRQVNSNQANGVLNLTAKKEVYTNQGQTKQYTSARLNSKFAFKYGKVEVRAKLASGAGTWPAIWMLGKNIIEPGAFWSSTFGTTSWPACGEIDIMEHWGNNQNYVQSAMHTPSSFGSTVNFGGQTVANASTQFHTYVMEWSANSIIFSVDNVVHYVYNPAVKNASTWPFNSEQYLLLNIAIEPSIISTSFVQTTMEIDYVRVYQQGALNTPSIADKSNVRVYPNPVSELMTIAVDGINLNSKGNLYSITGQLLHSFTLNETEKTIDVAGLAPGIYFLEIQSERGTERQKFIKK
jgi:beta-glucanase (GH16 family)